MATAHEKKAQLAITAHLQAQAVAVPSLTGGWLQVLFLSVILPIIDSLLILSEATIRANPKLMAALRFAKPIIDRIVGDPIVRANVNPKFVIE